MSQDQKDRIRSGADNQNERLESGASTINKSQSVNLEDINQIGIEDIAGQGGHGVQ